MLHYFIQTLLFQTLFLAIYDLFLRRETFFQWNRAYLMLSAILAYVIPFLKIEGTTHFIQKNIGQLPEVILNPEVIFLSEINLTANDTPFFTLENFYFLGIGIATFLFMYKIGVIVIKIYKHTIIKKQNYNLVILPKQQTAFSFFRYLFLGDKLYREDHEHIIKHELIHINQKHSIDLIYFELLKIVFWFNPFSYLFQHRISALHEFIADEKILKTQSKQSFFENLLAQTFQVEKFAFINQYYKKSLIKKRIIMITKNKSKEILKLKYLFIIPLILIMLVYTSCEKEDHTYSVEENIYKLKDLDQVPYLSNTKMTAESDKKVELIITLLKSQMKYLREEVKETFKVPFVISKTGEIIDVDYAETPKNLRGKVELIIDDLPPITAGKIKGEFVNSELSLIIIADKGSDSYLESESISLSVIDEVPVYPGCETSVNKKKCMVDKITKYVGNNFNVDLAQGLGLTLGKKRISIQFKIDNHGNVNDVKARAPHPKLKEEAIRVIENLPKMKPGKQKGKAVNVRYNLPIVFNVE